MIKSSFVVSYFDLQARRVRQETCLRFDLNALPYKLSFRTQI